MLANADIFEELEAIEKVRDGLKSEFEKAQLKGLVLTVKLLHNIRSNMVTVMKAQGIELVKPKIVKETV
jgi:hypothetical protein